MSLVASFVACSSHLNSGALAKIKRAKEREKTRGDWEKGRVPSLSSPVSPRFFSLLRSFIFSLELHYLNAWNRLPTSRKLVLGTQAALLPYLGFCHFSFGFEARTTPPNTERKHNNSVSARDSVKVTKFFTSFIRTS